jgi:transposase
VSVKTVEQQDIQAVHRVRFELSNQRKAKANQIRGLVSEYGLVAPKELLHLRAAIPDWLEDAENGLTVRFRSLLAGLYRDLQQLDERVSELDREIAAIAREHEPIGRLIASQIASASFASVLFVFTYGFTNCGAISFTR